MAPAMVTGTRSEAPGRGRAGAQGRSLARRAGAARHRAVDAEDRRQRRGGADGGSPGHGRDPALRRRVRVRDVRPWARGRAAGREVRRGAVALRGRPPFCVERRGSVRSRAYAATSCSWKLPLHPCATPASPSSPTACWSTGLAIDDATAVDLVRARLEAGDDPAAVIADAIEIGARVLSREQTGANVEFVKAELEKTAREVAGRVRRALPRGRRGLRPQVRRGVRAGDRARRAGAHEALRRRVVGGGAEPAQGRARRGDGRDAGRPAQAVHGRLGRQPVRGLPARLARRDEADVRPAARAPPRDERADAGPRGGARARAGGEGEGRGRRAGGRARHRQGPLVRGGRVRRARRDRGGAGRRLRRGGRRQGRHRQDRRRRRGDRGLHRARRAAASCSRRRRRGCRSRRRSRSSTARAPSARPTSRCSSCPTRSGSRRRCTSCASTAATS